MSTHNIEGLEEYLRNLKSVRKRYHAKALRAVSKAALFVLREAQKLTPVDLGNLRASGFVVVTGLGPSHTKFEFKDDPSRDSHANMSSKVASSTKETMEVALGLANANTKGVAAYIAFGAYYALFVHEETSMHHTVGQAKFLETVIKTRRNEIMKIYTDEMRKLF